MIDTKFSAKRYSGKLTGLIFLVILTLNSCVQTQHLAKVEPSNQNFSKEENLESDTQIDELLAPFQKEIDEKMSNVIGQCAYELLKAQPESSLGNFCADIIHIKTEEYLGEKIDFAAQNYGGIRIPYLAEGDITKGRIYELMPFENRIAVLELPGSETLRLINHMTARGGWPVSSSLRYFIFEKKAIEITVKGKPFDVNRTYRIALPDYIANGGDNCDFLKGHPRKDLKKLIREAYLEYITEQGNSEKVISPKVDGRVTVRNN